VKKNEEDNRFIFGESLPEEHEGIKTPVSLNPQKSISIM
jgi:hypothetical protein